MDLQRFAGERRLPATPRRRQRARQQGQVAVSADLATAVAFSAAAAVLATLGPRAASGFAAWAQTVWSEPGTRLWTEQGPLTTLAAGLDTVRGLVLRLGLAASGAGLLAAVAQTGLALSPTALQPRLERVSPATGVRRLLSGQSLVALLRALLKTAALIAVAWQPVAHLATEMAGAASPAAAAQQAAVTVRALLGRAALVFLALGVLDLLQQRRQLEQRLRMTTEEVRQEQREDEGDPQWRARRRRRQRELARRRMLADVRRADVVVVNPTHVAVALRYDPATMAAPVVLAKGAGWLAERIRELARLHGVMIVDNPPLARALHQAVRVGQAIPASLYQAVAEVLAFVWRVQGQL